jgi:adenylate cyclase
VVRLLNRYLGAMVEVVTQHNGTIDEFIGDAVLVIFGAPIWREAHACDAVSCAIAMQQAMDSVNEGNLRDGLPVLEMGVGVNTGEVVVGNIGSEARAKYGVVGSPVNLTSRIESYTIGGQVLISETTREAVGSIIRVAEQVVIEAKGVDEPITIYDVRGIGGSYDLHLPEREEAIVTLSERIPIRFSVVEGKHLGDVAFEGDLIRLSAQGGEILCDQPIAQLSNLKVRVMASDRSEVRGELYAKVTGPLASSEAGFAVHFTSIPPELAAEFVRLSGHTPRDEEST